jgi:hypothetical protein
MPRSPRPSRNGQAEADQAAATVVEPKADKPQATDVIQEAEALRRSLGDALAQAGRLVTALKRQRKQTRLVRATLASLQQLQAAGS